MKKTGAFPGGTQPVHQGESISEAAAIEDANALHFVAQCGFEDTERSDSSTHGRTTRARSCRRAVAAVLLFNFVLCRAVVVLKPKGKLAQVFGTDWKRPRCHPQGGSHDHS